MEKNREKRSAPREQGPRGADLIAGRNAIAEALRAGRAIDSLYVQRGERGGALQALVKKAKEAGAAIKEADPKKLDYLCGGANHQGVVAVAAVKEYATVEDLFRRAQEKDEPPFFVVCDELEDPHNLGAILRTAECAGAHGVIIPKRRSVGLTYAVGKASAGAVEYLPVARVTNLTSTIERLKREGIWTYAADMDGEDYADLDLSGPIALVIGAEGEGVSRRVLESCDRTISVPIRGKLDSLNASVAAGVLMYAVLRAR